MTEFNLADISRITVVDHRGCREFWADSWDMQLQDDGHTLKLVATGEGLQAQYERGMALTEKLAHAWAAGEAIIIGNEDT
jgi:hypothetical protein